MSRSGARDYGFKLVFEYLFSQDFIIEDELEKESLEGEEKDYALSILNFLKENPYNVEMFEYFMSFIIDRFSPNTVSEAAVLQTGHF